MKFTRGQEFCKLSQFLEKEESAQLTPLSSLTNVYQWKVIHAENMSQTTLVICLARKFRSTKGRYHQIFFVFITITVPKNLVKEPFWCP